MYRLNANNLVDALSEPLEVLPKKDWANLSMDGPSTNQAVSKSIQKQHQESEVPALVNLQSNGLHIIFGAFQTVVLKMVWELDEVWQLKEMV